MVNVIASTAIEGRDAAVAEVDGIWGAWVASKAVSAVEGTYETHQKLNFNIQIKF